jgi:predicted permease
MMSRSTDPQASHTKRIPRLAVLLLTALLPEGEREHVIGDLVEDCHDAAARGGIRAAQRTFWRQTIAAIWALSFVRRASATSPAPHGDSLMRQLWTDVRQAARSLRATPGFALLCAITLGLGIGSAAAMFGIVDRILLHGPDHVVAPERVMRFYATVKHPPNELETGSITSYAAYAGLRDGAHTFAGVGAYQSNSWIVGTGVNARSLPGVAASADLFATLGVRPYLGRFYSAAEDDPRAPQDVIVLAYEYWIRAFGGDRDVLGRTIAVAFRPFTVIGVAPPGFTGAELIPVDYWIPLSSGAHPRPDWPTTWQARWLQVVARVKPGVTVEQASTDAIAAFRRAYTGTQANWHDATISVRPISFTSEGQESSVAPLARWLTAVTMIVLLIACANIGNLLLARAVRRRGEIAVRLVLGMSRWRMTQLLLADGVLIAGLGGALGICVSYAAGSGIRRFFLSDIAWSTSPIDPPVLVMTIVLTAIVSVLVSATPLLQARRIDLSQAVRSGAREGGGRNERLRTVLLLAQTALTAVLLVGAGLFVRSLMNVRHLDLGIDTDKVIAASVYWPVAAPGDSSAKAAAAEQALTWNRIRDSVAHRSDVTGASLVIGSPFRSSFSVNLSVPGRDSLPILGGGGPYVTAVGADYFRTAGTRILSGRAFVAHEGETSVRTAIINETMARTLWPREQALGKCLLIGGLKQCATVVGIVADAHRFGIHEEPAMQYYVPIGQEIGISGTTLLVRPRGAVAPAIEIVRRTLAGLAPAARYVDVAPLQDRVDPQIRTWRVGAALFGAFAALAVIVAATGLYSVIGYLVTQRKREFGVRIAIGATPRNIVALVAGYGLRVVLVGLSAALFVAWALGGRIAPQLFDESPHDPVVYVGVSLTMIVVAMTALVAPAWRAARTDPASALRQE